MEYTNLGRTGLQVSRLCLGTMKPDPALRRNLPSLALSLIYAPKPPAPDGIITLREFLCSDSIPQP